MQHDVPTLVRSVMDDVQRHHRDQGSEGRGGAEEPDRIGFPDQAQGVGFHQGHRKEGAESPGNTGPFLGLRGEVVGAVIVEAPIPGEAGRTLRARRQAVPPPPRIERSFGR